MPTTVRYYKDGEYVEVNEVNPLPVSGGTAGAQYTEGDTDASITGTAAMWEDTSDTLRAASETYPLPVRQAALTATNDRASVVHDTAAIGQNTNKLADGSTLPFVGSQATLDALFANTATGWGLQLLMPWNTFGTGIGYRALAQLMPEWAWGALLVWVGLTKIGSYLVDHYRVRMAATLGATMIWTFLSVAFGVGNPYGTGVVVYPVLAFVSALIFWRLWTRSRERA